MIATRRQSLGKWGEALAAETLERRGYTLLERNARTPFGELDLVMHQGQVIVFVEVKTRRTRSYGDTPSFGLPEESITRRKQEHLLHAAQAYLQSHPQLGDNWRVDVVAIRRAPGSQPEVVHFENVLH